MIRVRPGRRQVCPTLAHDRACWLSAPHPIPVAYQLLWLCAARARPTSPDIVNMHTRNNSRMANIVEQGIIIDTLSGAVDAWTFLCSNAVPEHSILRVLLQPGLRRPSDSAFTSALPALTNTAQRQDRKSTRLNSSHTVISYAVFCL